MFDIGMFELVMIAIVGLVILGPQQMTAMIKAVITGVNKARQMSTQLSQQLNRELKNIETSVEEKPN
ncbi:Sec-independent protein translocase protein TatB [Paraferrimonas sedimenticola]|uniref:Sec-independent protein translocase protein TatB n=1 Tax=Paraferrimonas sedimenticola TaxID=375674 RepID=A0AA37RYE7_9GAMM|nr:Sec-independent protein translocase protein TatB [Paraferrimonas sedimenticola]GLP97611.1 hypothetical protein GCM10007895_29180 [Paraferrimonas sedimenticola]